MIQAALAIVRRKALLAALGGLVATGCTTSDAPRPQLRDSFSLGRNSIGEACTGVWRWNDPQASGPTDKSYAINCRSVAASRLVGTITAVPAGRPAAPDAMCGPSATLSVKGIGPVEARRCQDGVIDAGTVALSFTRNGKRYRGSALPYLLGPLEAGLRAVAGIAPPPVDNGEPLAASIDLAALPAGPAGSEAVGEGAGFSATAALQQGIILNRQGLYVESSRILNDALSRLAPDTPVALRIELALEAGLADSNISVFEAADEHFAQANALIAANPALDRATFLITKRSTYRAFDLLNRFQPRAALAELDKIDPGTMVGSKFPLEDPAVLRPLNQPRISRTDAARSLSGPAAARVDRDTLEIQRLRTRSGALLTIGDVDASEAAIVQAGRALDALFTDRIDRSPFAWLVASVERQHARVLARRKDWKGAVEHVDAALRAVDSASAGLGFSAGPAIADTRIDRADFLSRSGAPIETVMQEYQRAMDALAASGPGAVAPSSIDRYLDILIEQQAAAPGGDAPERFFRAIQVISTPAIARQTAELQNVVTADPELAGKYRTRTEAERDVGRLSFAIAEATAAGPNAPREGPTLAELEKQRSEAQGRLDNVVAELAGNARFRAIDDSPATLAEVRAKLKPGEVYLKLTALRTKTYGLTITAQGATIYALAEPTAALNELAAAVRKSIDGYGDSLRPFNVSSAYALFTLIAGPADKTLLAAKSIVIDPSGPLQSLPAGVLVTERASVDWYRGNRARAPFDFSKVAFLAMRADLSTSVSPRSFLITRALPQSTAAKAFLGLGSHVPPASAARADEASRAAVGMRCVDGAAIYRQIWNSTPISAREIGLAADALGDGGAPTMTGAAFTDSAVKERTDLDQYEVLHFATHGLPETRIGCAEVPPSLVTTLGASGSDGLLSYDEIAKLHLNANLVVLSACETASGLSALSARRSGQEGGATLAGLVRAFLAAQARAVVATYWQVPAGVQSDELIAAFYGSGRTTEIGSALRTAQTDLIRQPAYSHPFHWGAYFVVGDGSKTMLAGKTAVAAVSR